MSYPSPGGSQEPPSFSESDVRDALASIARAEGKPLIEETIGPAEAHLPTLEEAEDAYDSACERAMKAELRAGRLARDFEEARRELDNEKMLRDAVMVVSARKDRDYYVMCGIAALLGVALIGAVGVMAWRLM